VAATVDLTTTTASLEGWTPIRVGWGSDRPVVDWCLTRGVPFAEPFFDQTVEECFRDPCRLLFRRSTGMEELRRFAVDHPGLPPAGFIFHMSRCGSTLVARMLAAVPEHLVVSEAGPLDSVLRAAAALPHLDDDEHGAWVRAMVAALGQRRDHRQRRLFVKFDAWSALDLDVIRRTFPDVPWLFVFRDPVEVLVSHFRRRGAHVIPGVLDPASLGLTPAEVTALPPEHYAAVVLARICQAALQRESDPLATFVDYRQLPGFVLSQLAHDWAVPSDGPAWRLMGDAARSDAKNPFVPFEDDGPAKQAQASAELRAAADRWLQPLHERLVQAARRRR
jgi:hypothetical protein